MEQLHAPVREMSPAVELADRAAEAAASTDVDVDGDSPESPSSLLAILDPEAALAAARRMQRWYQSTPQGAAHSLFGRDGRRVEGRLQVEYAEAD